MQIALFGRQTTRIAIGQMILLSMAIIAQAQTHLINDNFNDETTVLSLHPTADTLAWKFSTNGGVSGTACLVSEMVSNSTGGHTEDYYASKSLSLIAGNTYEITFKCNVQTAGKRKALLAWSTSGEREGSTLIEDFGSITNTESFTTYSTTFSIPFSGTYHLIYYGEDLDAPATASGLPTILKCSW